MKDYKKMIFVSLVVAVASQVGLGLISSDFIVSAGIISFMLFLFYYEDLKPIPTGILSGIMVYLLRVLVHYLGKGNIMDAITSYQQEILFYMFYSIIYSLLIRKGNKNNINFLFFTMVISDFGANFIEVYVRTSIDVFSSLKEVGGTLLVVSIIRSAILWLVLNALKYYRMFLMKEEHERRYKRLLWLTSQLKTEMYWIEKNMDHIEKVMSESYKLFEKINLNIDNETWANLALSIARDVHEIKKENGLVIRGIKEITENQLNDKGMDFKDIINILSETMKREIKRVNKDINLTFNTGKNFYTSKHYYLMSIFRNLIMNSMDAMPEDKKDGVIIVIHEVDKNNHRFTIADNGTGIDEEGLNHIFSPGFSTKINYSTGEINRGLGLSIVKYIVEEQLNGNISASSKKGEGTDFYISIPKESLEEEVE
ncbi:ATP-binding protein [Tissierella pigra]|uniref:histidine kinase n=1 Tax=Tissierella pigra TaxID=2607614 RepID=A0A6N7XXA3_9FIRM|nr:ATP-binding protein [Tissierella pigra]MBU5425558.1 ATP-binding protein [Tissierella pigra]MSU00888.1 ATP-binding protein [Tissierella pigra]